MRECAEVKIVGANGLRLSRTLSGLRTNDERQEQSSKHMRASQSQSSAQKIARPMIISYTGRHLDASGLKDILRLPDSMNIEGGQMYASNLNT